MNLNCRFGGKIIKKLLGWIPGFFRIHPVYEFRLFSDNGHSDDDYLREKFKKSYIGWIRKNSDIHPGYPFFMILPPKWQFRLENESFENWLANLSFRPERNKKDLFIQLTDQLRSFDWSKKETQNLYQNFSARDLNIISYDSYGHIIWTMCPTLLWTSQFSEKCEIGPTVCWWHREDFVPRSTKTKTTTST